MVAQAKLECINSSSPPPSFNLVIYEVKVIIALTFTQNKVCVALVDAVCVALVDAKSHLTTSTEPAKIICGEESNTYIYLEKD